MGKPTVFTTRLAVLTVLHAAGAGLASPTVLVTRTINRLAAEWLPTDNQTFYRLGPLETRSLELNTSTISQTPVYITVSPCSSDIHWALYRGNVFGNEGQLNLYKEYTTGELATISLTISKLDRYLLKLSSKRGSAVAVSVRGEAERSVRLRLRVRSKRRLATNWDPSPIDPQSTTYCVIASNRKNFTSLCGVQSYIKVNRLENRPDRLSDPSLSPVSEGFNPQMFPWDNNGTITDIENRIDADPDIVRMVYRKICRSTKVTDEDPVIACVGDRTHHLIENLNPSLTYYVNVFGISKDRRVGSLLASGSVRPRTTTAKRLKENQPNKSDLKGRSVYYFKATIGSGGGLWLTVTTCGGAVDIEVLVREKRLYMAKNIGPHSKIFIPAPIPSSSMQEISDEGSVQFDSSSEETRMRYVIKVVPTIRDGDSNVNIEITASTSRWGANFPELLEDGAVVREIRLKRSCRSLEIAFLPASHYANDIIRYCITSREMSESNGNFCASSKKSHLKSLCINHEQRSPIKAIVQKISGLKAGRKYGIQVTASCRGNTVPYNVLYADTNVSCKGEQ